MTLVILRHFFLPDTNYKEDRHPSGISPLGLDAETAEIIRFRRI